ncbi:hypothetical protein NEOLI_001746 [Neolecta irregularis DAH-3]|uniref:Uncharacterized protein n=1 Tax=Neolecta irregularis (strain DAH-3) TaxID=1198029 RepID=A0A1U7LVX8_NEOID|nr:hypothetical protein NEOLI_001746 [Neolecta irregularis DAH-3]|eukprot:OLL26778.1 hypothetical protein NEOLI_001746 [Neolecta irregularis DAH-3]
MFSSNHPFGVTEICSTHHILTSPSNPHGITPIDFGSAKLNPNILPLPPNAKYPYFIIGRSTTDGSYQEIVACFADFEHLPLTQRRILKCVDEPKVITVPSTKAKKCEKTWMELVKGPHDPRVFWSPKGEPLMTFGTQSSFTCFGQWIVDLRAVYQPLNDLLSGTIGGNINFSELQELRRPEPYGEFEKNWFLIWDETGDMYVHHDSNPRVFSKLGVETPVNLAQEKPCRSLPDPSLLPEGVDHHQSTNTLLVFLCKRLSCPPNPPQVLISIHQKKYFEMYHAFYQRYVIVYSATFPFHEIGRTKMLDMLGTKEGEMNYIVSLAWEVRNQGSLAPPKGHVGEGLSDQDATSWKEHLYDGYLDDTVLISLGIEDKYSAMLDVIAQDLVGCLDTC